jgi:hypothetical protein
VTHDIKSLEHAVDAEAVHFNVTIAFAKLIVGVPVPAVIEFTFQGAGYGH